MANRALTPLSLDLSRGFADGIGEDKSHVMKMHGFECRDGYVRSVYGREKQTSSEIVTSARVRDVKRWLRSDLTDKHYAYIDGALREGSTPSAFAAVRSTLLLDYVPSTGASRSVTATRASNVVTFAGTYPKALLTLQVGDQFYYDADGYSGGGIVASVDSDTQITLTSYTGAGTSGAFVIVRKMTDSADSGLIIADDKIWIFDGVNRPHWYDGTNFREAGMPAPESRPAMALTSLGATALSAGNYWWEAAYEDIDGNVSNTIVTQELSATEDDKNTLSGFVNGPSWAVKVRVYRTKAGGSIAYSIAPDVTAQLATAVESGGSTTLTLHADAIALIANMHIHRYVKFADTGTYYLITGGTATTVVVLGDASSATGGESGTDYITISGGFDIDQAVAGNIIDVTPDANLNVDNKAPDQNTRPPAKLMYPRLIQGGGRLIAYEDGSQTKAWFSGRGLFATTETGTQSNGLGEFQYWNNYHYAGNKDGDEIMGFFVLGSRVFCAKKQSVWELFKQSTDVAEWSWAPVLDNIGCVAPRTIVVKDRSAYWLGHDGEELDVIRFTGSSGFGMFRQFDPDIKGSRISKTLDTFVMGSITECTATIFRGRFFLSYPHTGQTTNSRTLRWDFKRPSMDVQPWGCGAFSNIYQEDNGAFWLLCGDPTTAGNVFRVLGSQADNGGNISREFISGRAEFEGVANKGKWTHVLIRAIHSEAITAAPTLSYSVDGLAFDDTNKVWETTISGDTWPTTIGEKNLHFAFETGEDSDGVMLKIVSADAKDWGIKNIEIWGGSYAQLNSME